MKITHPNKRCPQCKQYNLRVAINRKRFGKRYFLTCDTPGCLFYGPESLSKNGAIRKWNKTVGGVS